MAKATKKEAGKHSSPLTAGKQNLSKKNIEMNKDKREPNQMGEILGVFEHGRYILGEYGGLWTEESLEDEIYQYFTYCTEVNLKPAKVGLRLWLGLSKSQYWEWETKPEKYTWKSNQINQANDFMELQYIGRLELYPTGNQFLLKAQHNYIDKQTVEVNTHNEISKDEISDVVNKLGLDK